MTKFSFVALDVNGEKVGAVFTSLMRMKESLGKDFNDARWFSTNARALLRAIHPQWRIILNPRCSFGHEFTHEEIQLLLEARISELDSAIQAPSKSEYETRRPVEYPEDLLRYMKKYFDERGDISKAYVTELSAPSRNEAWHLFIGITLRNRGKTRFGEVLAGIERIVRAIYPSGKMMDIIEINSDEDRDKWFDGTEPFYDKG